jgi:hypothetical protein
MKVIIPTESQEDLVRIIGILSDDEFITYTRFINGDNKGKEIMEYYSGRDYLETSLKRGYYRRYIPNKIPKKYFMNWSELRNRYLEFDNLNMLNRKNNRAILSNQK